MPGISAARVRALEKLDLQPFRSKTLLPGSIPGISAVRARANVQKQRLEAKRYFRDLCPGVPRHARARVVLEQKLELEPFRSKTLLPGSMPGNSAARAHEARS